MPRKSCIRSKHAVRTHSRSGKTYYACRPKKSRSPTRGWKEVAPHKGRERHKISRRCPSKCFLLPKQEKFPICKASRTRSGRVSCKIDPHGVSAAYNRARQLRAKYPRLSAKALRIAKRMNLSWAKSK